MNKFVKNTLLTLVFIPLATGVWFWGGYVLSTLWGWFLTEQFGIVPITTTQAMGVGCVVSCFTWTFARSDQIEHLNKPKKSRWERVYDGLLGGAIGPLVALWAGWALHQFMLSA